MQHAISYSFVKKTPDGKVFGMQVAILDLLHAYLKYSRQEKLSFLTISDQSRLEVEEVARANNIDLARLSFHQAPYASDVLQQFDTIFRVDPMPGDLLKLRHEMLADNDFAFCGLAHALAGAQAGQVLERYCLHPSQNNDAIICPSRAIASVVRRFWDLYEEYLKQKFGVSYRCPVSLPVIPLGVNIERFEQLGTGNKRAQQRLVLDVGDNDIVVLWVGRLSAAIKAHPLAMFRAVELAAKETGRKIHFVMQGYFAPAEAEAEFHALARDFCPSVKVRFIPGNHPAFPDGLWAAGDIFLSLVDNMQESFGLTPIEAIAAGLPRVISDWDGYRDSVNHGVDGFLVPTTQPKAGMGAEFAHLVLEDDDYYAEQMAKTALCVAVDHHFAAACLILLIQNPELRKTMSQAAKTRLPDYAWKNIINKYEDLWDELAARKCQNERPSSRGRS